MLQLAGDFRAPGGGLYRLTEYDKRTGANERRFFYSRETTYTGVNSAFFMLGTNIAPNLALVIEHLQYQIGTDNAGAEQVTEIAVRRVEVGIVAGHVLRKFATVGLGQSVDVQLNSPIILMPGEDLSFFTSKSAAVQQFRTTASAFGRYIPRGNIQSG